MEALKSVLNSIPLVHLLDWGVVVLGLGLALYWARNSRAIWMVRGFVTFLLFYLLASPLPTLHLVLDKILTGMVVALALVFQPELRKVLEALGRGTSPQTIDAGSRLEGEEGEDYLDELIQAVKDLSQNRTGALMVIEHEEPLDPRVFTDGGVKINAAVSRELLQTIFQTSTLLHDGAVLIRQNQIKAAGVILPISDRVATRQLGTRHRAALGITEQATCLCIVVSEETGSISLAEAGRLDRPLTSSKLRELLVQRLRPQHPLKETGLKTLGQRLWPQFWLSVKNRIPPVRSLLNHIAPKE